MSISESFEICISYQQKNYILFIYINLPALKSSRAKQFDKDTNFNKQNLNK